MHCFGAVLFIVPLFIGYFIATDFLKIELFKIVMKLNMLPLEYSPLFIIFESSISIIPLSILCGLLFATIFQKDTVYLSILSSAFLLALLFLITPRHPSESWQTYLDYGLFIAGFILTGGIISKNRKANKWLDSRPGLKVV